MALASRPHEIRTYTSTLSRKITITAPISGSGTVTQSIDVDITKTRYSDYQTLTIKASSPIVFTWTSGGYNYKLTITAESLAINNYSGGDCGGYDIYGLFCLTATNVSTNHLSAVPEPTTVVSGALLLLPLGVSVVRIVRKKHSV